MRKMQARAKKKLATRRTARTAAAGPTPKDEAVLARLHEALSEDEIRHILAAALQSLDEAGWCRLQARIGTDTSATLRAVLDTPGTERNQREQTIVPGKAKIDQEWKKLWCEWEDAISEVSSETGQYAQQDEPWEEPYLDTVSLAADLERIAKQLRVLLPRVWDGRLDPDLSVAEVFEEAREAIEKVPEGIIEGEPLEFGKEATGLLVDWEWRKAERESISPFHFVDRLCALDVNLSGEPILSFVKGLGDAEQRQILKGITERRDMSPWAEALQHPHSDWFRLYAHLASTWDRTLYSNVALAHIDGDYTLALPLMSECLRTKAFADVVPLAERAARALLGMRPEETWDPRRTLIVRTDAMRWTYPSDDANVVRLLETWRRAASALGQEELASALEIQTVVAKKRDDWDAVLAAFQATPVPLEALFSDWRLDAAERSVGPDGADFDGSHETETPFVWVKTLVDTTVLARTDASGARSLFLEAVRDWLAAIQATPADFERYQRSFALLALDVGTIAGLGKRYPQMHQRLAEVRGGQDQLAKVRRRWLVRLGAAELANDIIAFISRNARLLIPDPGRGGGSNYDDCASWVAAIIEVDQAAGQALVRQWGVDHKRRRNLWVALAKRGIAGQR
jgi:hypothetical protein